MIHLPVNLQRLFLSCKQLFELRDNFGTNMGLSDLSPSHVINSVNILCNSLSIYPGRDERKLSNDKFFKEANNYATELIKIYLH